MCAANSIDVTGGRDSLLGPGRVVDTFSLSPGTELTKIKDRGRTVKRQVESEAGESLGRMGSLS